jgi:hypothetical protein
VVVVSAGKLSLGPSLPKDGLEIDGITVAVPARRFRVHYEVVRGRPIPAAQDFALRLLRTSGSLAVEDFASFFGWNSRELAVLLSALIRDELVREVEGSLSLGPAGIRAFRDELDPLAPPTIATAELRTDTVVLDKISLNFAREPARGARHMAALPVLAPADRKRASDTKVPVGQAFRRHYGEFVASRFPKETADQAPRLQAVVDIEAKGHVLSEITLPIRLYGTGSRQVEPDFSELEALGAAGSRAELITALTRHLATLRTPEDEMAAMGFLSVPIRRRPRVGGDQAVAGR